MKSLAVYFSYTNKTKTLLEGINKVYNFDTIRIERVIPYSENYDQCAYVEARDEYEQKIYPDIKKIDINVNKYDKILLFFPIWWYTFPMAIGTFVKQIKDYKGEIVVFANSHTNDSGYMSDSMRDLRDLAPKIKFKQGLFNRPLAEHIDFIKNI